jgi:hypothetical protein
MPRPALVFGLALALLAAPAGAQDYVPAKIGLVVTYQSWRAGEADPASRSALPPFRLEIRSTERDFAVTHVEEGERMLNTVVLRGILTIQGSVPGRHVRLEGDLAPVRALWPLSAGKVAELQLSEASRVGGEDAQWQATGRSYVYRFRVLGKEEITLPGGTMRTWVIAREVFLRGDAGDTRTEQSRTWFAPALGWWVKFEHRAPDPSGAIRLTLREAASISGQ